MAAFLRPDELERVLAAIDWDFAEKRKRGFARDGEIQWLKDLILLAVGTGLRLRELTSLRWSDIDPISGFLTVRNRDGFRTKSGDERPVPLAGDALDVLERRSGERVDEVDGPVLTYGNGHPLVPDYASKRFKYYVRLAKLDERLKFHSLRHTTASWLVQRGVPLSIVQQILGHSSIQVTERYAHLAPDVMKAAMEQAFGSRSQGRYFFYRQLFISLRFSSISGAMAIPTVKTKTPQNRQFKAFPGRFRGVALPGFEPETS